MSRSVSFLVFFLYGLAFFNMGLIVALEGGRGSDERLRHALRPLAAFGIIHGVHEWLEMAVLLGALPFQEEAALAWEGLRAAMLAFSFLSLAAFGASLLSPNQRIRRLSLLLPLVQVAIWGFGIFVMRSRYTLEMGFLDVVDVWIRYVLGIPASFVAAAGLIAQQRAFRRVGMAQFGRDSLWASIAFAWYGLVGQAFTRASLLPPSTFINQNLFLDVFGFPVQLLRAVAAGAASAFVVRFLRAFEVERQHQIASLQDARLDEAKKREAMRGDLLRRVVEAQEAERQRIARELHDETGQALTAIGLGLRGVEGTIYLNGEKATRNLRHLEELVSHSLDELQRLIADLRPSHLDDLGLPAALRWYISEVQKRSTLDVTLELEGEEHPIPGTVNTALFRVAQEALTNVLKHASASSAQIWLSFEEENVRIRVWDDGCGFDSEQLAFENAASWGLMGMRERAELLGGEFHILSRPGRGTLVEVTIPYQEDQPNVPFEDIDENEIVVN